jgi:ceramide glucosyltransferase
MVIWLALPALAAAAYYLLAIIAVIQWEKEPGRPSSGLPIPEVAQASPCGPGFQLRADSQDPEGAPVCATRPSQRLPVSILKPVHGRSARFYEAIRSHAAQDYSEFEIIFGVSDPADPALEDIERLQREFPNRSIRVFAVSTQAPNIKAGVLAAIAEHARWPVILVNDGDILVEPGYLDAVTRPLADPNVGMTTCLYRAAGESRAARWEALGIATEFAPSVMVARLIGVAEFALGSTMVFRAEQLRKAGGFEAIADYLADDYQLGRLISRRGYRIAFAPAVVQTDLGDESWVGMWRHQLRWSRTIRVSRPAGYYGYVVTHATVWAVLAFAVGLWWAGAAAVGLRLVAAYLVGARVLKDGNVKRFFWMIPLRDLFGFAVWAGAIFGSKVLWRGQKLRLSRDGKIRKLISPR